MEDATAIASEERLYSPWQVTGAALLGGALPGLWLIADNFLALGNAGIARTLRIVAIGVGLALLAFVVFGPELRSYTGIGALSAVAVRWYATASYGKAYEEHTAGGGSKRPQWQWVIAGLAGIGATMLVGMAVILGLATVAPGLLPDRLFD